MNVQRGYVPVSLDKDRHLKFDLNALALIEEKLGMPISELQTRLAKPAMRDIRTILWAGFVHEDPSLTEEQVGAAVNVANIEALVTALLAAFDAAAGKGEPGKNARRPNRSTGGKPSERRSASSV